MMAKLDHCATKDCRFHTYPSGSEEPFFFKAAASAANGSLDDVVGDEAFDTDAAFSCVLFVSVFCEATNTLLDGLSVVTADSGLFVFWLANCALLGSCASG